jgi:hypothetical protein
VVAGERRIEPKRPRLPSQGTLQHYALRPIAIHMNHPPALWPCLVLSFGLFAHTVGASPAIPQSVSASSMIAQPPVAAGLPALDPDLASRCTPWVPAPYAGPLQGSNETADRRQAIATHLVMHSYLNTTPPGFILLPWCRWAYHVRDDPKFPNINVILHGVYPLFGPRVAATPDEIADGRTVTEIGYGSMVSQNWMGWMLSESMGGYGKSYLSRADETTDWVLMDRDTRPPRWLVPVSEAFIFMEVVYPAPVVQPGGATTQP